jgi:hypothetical protein
LPAFCQTCAKVRENARKLAPGRNKQRCLHLIGSQKGRPGGAAVRREAWKSTEKRHTAPVENFLSSLKFWRAPTDSAASHTKLAAGNFISLY